MKKQIVRAPHLIKKPGGVDIEFPDYVKQRAMSTAVKRAVKNVYGKNGYEIKRHEPHRSTREREYPESYRLAHHREGYGPWSALFRKVIPGVRPRKLQDSEVEIDIEHANRLTKPRKGEHGQNEYERGYVNSVWLREYGSGRKSKAAGRFAHEVYRQLRRIPRSAVSYRSLEEREERRGREMYGDNAADLPYLSDFLIYLFTGKDRTARKKRGHEGSHPRTELVILAFLLALSTIFLNL